MRVNRRRLTPARYRREALAAKAAALIAETATAPAELASEPPRREHLFGSQYRVRMSFGEVLAARGHGRGGRDLRRRIAETTEARRQHEAAARRAGWGPGQALLGRVE